MNCKRIITLLGYEISSASDPNIKRRLARALDEMEKIEEYVERVTPKSPPVAVRWARARPRPDDDYTIIHARYADDAYTLCRVYIGSGQKEETDLAMVQCKSCDRKIKSMRFNGGNT